MDTLMNMRPFNTRKGKLGSPVHFACLVALVACLVVVKRGEKRFMKCSAGSERCSKLLCNTNPAKTANFPYVTEAAARLLSAHVASCARAQL
eukprot:scaffold117340_cov17-Tisochrysis_lutea.AAC.1